MKISEKVRTMLRDFLKIEEPYKNSITVRQEMDYQTNAFKNCLWYRGKATELDQFYKQVPNYNCSFWGSVPSVGREIRKLHTGLPRIGVNLLTNIVVSDFSGFEFGNNEEAEKIWNEIAEENAFAELLKEAVKEVQYIGDGAFKISFDADISERPIIEWFPGDKINIIRERGRVKEIVFYVEYQKKSKKYVLEEHYGYGYINYALYCGENEIGLDVLEETKNLSNVVFSDYNNTMLAVPFMITKSEEFKGRGQSIFDGKIDNFDALDEAYSQWWQAMRQARPKEYIPEGLIPRDPNTGALMRANSFDNQFIKIADDNSENGKNEVKLNQPNFPTNDYLQTYMTALDLCLQGWISPSTLGIDVKKLDNADAQREKEKATLYSRQSIIEALENVLPALVTVTLASYYIAKNEKKEIPKITVTFGEYANPSFEAMVETLSNPNTPMSIEAKVEEMWGDSKDDNWKAEEVRRIKEQSGIAMMDEPTFGQEIIVEEE